MALTANAVAGPGILIDTLHWAFGEVPVGSSVSKSVQLFNTGNAPLTISNIATTGPLSVSSNCPLSLPSRNGCTLAVTFTPVAAGAAVGTVSVYDNATGFPSPQVITFTGSGALPVIQISPAALNFGGVAVGSSSAQGITIFNTGTATLTVNSISAPTPFVVTNHCGSVAPQSSCKSLVTFTPTSIGPASALLTITDNAGGSPHTLALSGTGLSASVNVPSALSFGNVMVGTSAVQTLIVTNAGNAALSFTNMSASAPFAYGQSGAANTCFGASVAPNASCSVQVTYTPTQTGAASGVLKLYDNALQSPQTVTLTGNGTAFALAVSPATQTISAGHDAVFTATVSPLAGFTGAVPLGCTAAQGFTCSVTPALVNVSAAKAATATVTVSPGKGSKMHGTFTMVIWAGLAPNQKSVTVTVNVK